MSLSNPIVALKILSTDGALLGYKTDKRIVQYHVLSGFSNVERKDLGYMIRMLGGEYNYDGKIVDGVEMGFMSRFWK
jgi:hypothetical protein